MDFIGESGSKYDAVGDIAEDVLDLMEELYQSGFDTVHDSTIEGIKKAVIKTEQHGMKYLSELLEKLFVEISAGRHQMKSKTPQAAEFYTEIMEYLYLCRQKAAYDRGKEHYS